MKATEQLHGQSKDCLIFGISEPSHGFCICLSEERDSLIQLADLCSHSTSAESKTMQPVAS